MVNLVFLFLYFVLPKKKWHAIKGSFKDINKYLDILRKSDLPDASLIISIAGTDDYIQLTNSQNALCLHYTVNNDHQKKRESAFKGYAKKMSLKVTESRSDDNKNTFLDIDLTGSMEDTHVIVTSLLSEAFEAELDATLEFDLHA
jgi:hypothetical protein